MARWIQREKIIELGISYLVLGLNTRIPIQTFKRALEFEGMNVEIEEAEWMLANMIYKVSY